MKTLILDVGVSRARYSVFDGEDILFEGVVDKIGKDESYYVYEGVKKGVKVSTITEAIRLIIHLVEKNNIKLDAVGHKVVHGGQLDKPCLVNSSLLNKLKDVGELIPQYTFPELRAIEVCQKLIKKPQVAIFDTAFHQTMPQHVYTYALPHKLSQQYNIRKYGFYGTSHKYAAEEASKILKKKTNQLKIITCHIGKNSSVTAISKGKSFDTSMGFTPVEGLVMGRRCGDIDPSILSFLMENELYTTDEIENILNRKSGLLGISGKTWKIDQLLKSKDKKCKLAMQVFIYKIIKYIGTYVAALNGVDAIVFTGDIAEEFPPVREMILSNFSYVGLKLDKRKNKKNEKVISDNKSKVKVLIVPRNDSLMMVRDVRKVLKK